jgi:hypothetical protein
MKDANLNRQKPTLTQEYVRQRFVVIKQEFFPQLVPFSADKFPVTSPCDRSISAQLREKARNRIPPRGLLQRFHAEVCHERQSHCTHASPP